MVEKIKSHYLIGSQKKYFLLKVAITIHDGKRTLMHALAIPTNVKVTELKRMEYSNMAYAEFLLDANDFFNLIFQKKDELTIDNFIIPYAKHCSVDEYFIPTVEDDYGLKRPYKIFRIRVGGNPYCYGSLSHPDYPSYANCYDLIEHRMGIKLTPNSSVDFCVLFPVERAWINNFKIGSNKFKFQVQGNLNNLICKYNLRTSKITKRDEFKVQKNNIIRFKGKIVGFGLDLWYGNSKLDYITTRHLDNSKLAGNSLYNFLDKGKEESKLLPFKKTLMNPWVITIIGGIMVGLILLLFVN